MSTYLSPGMSPFSTQSRTTFLHGAFRDGWLQGKSQEIFSPSKDLVTNTQVFPDALKRRGGSSADCLKARAQETRGRSAIYTPAQEGYLNAVLRGAGQMNPEVYKYFQSVLSDDPRLYGQMFAPAYRSFEEQTLPALASRFHGRRGGGSAAQIAKFLAAEQLEEALQSQRSDA